MAAAHVYQPLSTNEVQLRLIDLMPGPGVISCRLRHVSLKTSEPYEALSYAWGPPTPTRQILVNDRTFLVRRNLHTALGYLRKGAGLGDGDAEGLRLPRTLWIDAICINQEDNEEKSIYIPLIRDIYQACHRTIIWLGVHGWLTKSAFKGIEFLSSLSDDPDHPSGVRFYKWPEIKRQRSGNNGGPGWLVSVRSVWGELHAQAAFHSLFSRPWFTRLWVVQELALSQQAVFVCGIYKMDWAAIERAQLVAMPFFPGDSLIMPLLLQKWSDDHGPYDIGTHMLATWQKHATVSKDKIYGLMGLPSTDNKDVIVDVD